MLPTIHTKNKPNAVATLRKESVDKPSAFGSLTMENLQEEVWKDVVGFEGLYQVSNLCNIRSLTRKIINHNGIHNRLGMHIKKQNRLGYNCVCIYIGGKSFSKMMHRLIAEAFIPNPKNKPCINHINGIRNDNRIENLEWVTHRENTIHSYVVLNRKKRKERQVLQYTMDGVFIAEFNSIQSASKETKSNAALICSVCRGIRNYTNGFIFKYKN